MVQALLYTHIYSTLLPFIPGCHLHNDPDPALWLYHKHADSNTPLEPIIVHSLLPGQSIQQVLLISTTMNQNLNQSTNQYYDPPKNLHHSWRYPQVVVPGPTHGLAHAPVPRLLGFPLRGDGPGRRLGRGFGLARGPVDVGAQDLLAPGARGWALDSPVGAGARWLVRRSTQGFNLKLRTLTRHIQPHAHGLESGRWHTWWYILSWWTIDCYYQVLRFRWAKK